MTGQALWQGWPVKPEDLYSISNGKFDDDRDRWQPKENI